MQLHGVVHVSHTHREAQRCQGSFCDVLGRLVGVVYVEALPVAAAAVLTREDLHLELEVVAVAGLGGLNV